MTRSHEDKCAACEVVRRYGTEVTLGLSELVDTMEIAADQGATDPWPAIRRWIAELDTGRLASLAVWIVDPDHAGFFGTDSWDARWFKRLSHTLHTELELRASVNSLEDG